MSSGGRRPNSGRKAEGGEPKVTVTFRVTPAAKERMKGLKDKGVLIGKLINDYILTL